MSARATVAAVDLGASSGRVMLARVGADKIELTEVHRFTNPPVSLPTGLHWDLPGLHREVLTGLRTAARALDHGEHLESIGIDAWAVDHGLVDADGELIGTPHHYRDPRHARGVERVHAAVPFDELYAVNGLQFLPFTTLYQLAADTGSPRHDVARSMLLVPDLLAFWLTGRRGAEITNASTTGLLDVHTQDWSHDLARRLGLPFRILPALRRPGDDIASLLPPAAAEAGLDARTRVTAVASHDTASAVAGVPARDEAFAYISCGTWSLVGVELPAPVLTAAGRAANFTNELGVDGRTRYLRNVMGLWLLNECLRTWRERGQPANLRSLLAEAARLPPGGPVVDADDPAFLLPGDMPDRLAAACRRRDEPVPASRAELVRCILDSLAAAHARAVRDAVVLSGRTVEVIHIVGGGARNALLCRLTADASGLPVVAGPVEATALGNALVQARSQGVVHGDVTELREILRRTQATRTFLPRGRS